MQAKPIVKVDLSYRRTLADNSVTNVLRAMESDVIAKRICLVLASSWLMVASGCTLCGAPDDYAYGCYGGKHERADRCHGRVFSAFEPAGIVSHEEAVPADSYDYFSGGTSEIVEDVPTSEATDPQLLPETAEDATVLEQ